MQKGDVCTVYMRLVDEAVDAWRPVKAIFFDEATYIIDIDQEYDQEIEEWEFAPGSIVICMNLQFRRGVEIAAVGRRKYNRITKDMQLSWTYPNESGWLS